MPVTRAFLKPVTVEPPPQGDYEFRPQVNIYEADSAAELAAAMQVGATVQANDPTTYYVVESVQYQTTVCAPEQGNQPAVVKYSALVHSSLAVKV